MNHHWRGVNGRTSREIEKTILSEAFMKKHRNHWTRHKIEFVMRFAKTRGVVWNRKYNRKSEIRRTFNSNPELYFHFAHIAGLYEQ